jgi:hypothetical protein
MPYLLGSNAAFLGIFCLNYDLFDSYDLHDFKRKSFKS